MFIEGMNLDVRARGGRHGAGSQSRISASRCASGGRGEDGAAMRGRLVSGTERRAGAGGRWAEVVSGAQRR